MLNDGKGFGLNIEKAVFLFGVTNCGRRKGAKKGMQNSYPFRTENGPLGTTFASEATWTLRLVAKGGFETL